jgi:hypothetical protein
MILSDINLLPQKERTSLLFIISLIFLMLVALIGATSLFVHHYSLTEKLASHKKELKVVVKQRELEEKRISDGTMVVNASQRFDQLVKVVDNRILPTMKILDHVSALLPNQGFITNYSYTDPGTISITGEFGTLPDVAAYLHWLTASTAIEKVGMHSVSCDCGENGLYTAQYSISLSKGAFTPKEGEKK